MKAHEIMKSQVVKVKEEDCLCVGIKKMLKHRISGLPVVNERNELIGFLSDEEIIKRIGKQNEIVLSNFFFADVYKIVEKEFVARAQEILTLDVKEVAAKKVYAVKWDEEVEHIAALLAKKQIRQLPVIRNGVLVGIISRRDVIRAVFQPLNKCVKKSVC